MTNQISKILKETLFEVTAAAAAVVFVVTAVLVA